MEKSDLLDDHLQIGNSNPTDTVIPGSEEQLIDLDEVYEETEQDTIKEMYAGYEEFLSGIVRKETALLMGCEDFNLDPYPSEHNARVGNEGFLTTIFEGFRKFIEAIIRYVKSIVDWIIGLVRKVFGFQKTDRQVEEINKKLPALKKEFEDTVVGLGFDTNIFNVTNFISNLPPGKERYPQLEIMASKMQDDQEAIGNLLKVVPEVNKGLKLLTRLGDDALFKARRLTRTIDEEYKKFKIGLNNGSIDLDSSRSTVFINIHKAIMELKVALDPEEVLGIISFVFKESYGLKVKNEELARGINAFQEEIQNNVVKRVVDFPKGDVSAIMAHINKLSVEYAKFKDSEINLKNFNWKALGDVINRPDTLKVEEVSLVYKSPQLLQAYQGVSKELKLYLEVCNTTAKELSRLKNQFVNIVTWHSRINAYYMSGVTGDFEKVSAILKEARDKGLNPLTEGMQNIPPLEFVDTSAGDPTTKFEIIAAHINVIYDMDAGGIKSSINNFKKQVGY